MEQLKEQHNKIIGTPEQNEQEWRQQGLQYRHSYLTLKRMLAHKYINETKKGNSVDKLRQELLRLEEDYQKGKRVFDNL